MTGKIVLLKKEHHNLRVMYQDEAGFGRINKPKRCWCAKGHRPIVPCHHIREYRYLYGAVSPLDGEMFALVMSSADTVCMNIFLEELAKAYPDDYILLVMDNAAWHHSKTLEIPENIELYSLLPYTPELNPIEQIWEDIREKGFRNEVFITLSKVVDRLCEVTLNLMNDTSRVASITHRKWLMNALMF
jgi:putative transposase